jgi:hypothetical protein
VSTMNERCWCLVSDRTPRDTIAVLLGRTVLLIVAQWFVPRARERDDFPQVRAVLRGVIPYFLGWVCMYGVLQVASPEWRRAIEMKIMGVPPGPYIHDRSPTYMVMTFFRYIS